MADQNEQFDENEPDLSEQADGSGAADAAAPEPDAEPAGEAVPEAAPAPESGAAPVDGDEWAPEDQALLDDEATRLAAEREQLEATAAGHLDDLQRLQAEYVNYRKRIERERAGDRDATVITVVKSLLPALDDLDLADKHGDLADGPMAIVAAKLRGGFEALGLERLGVVGEAFSTDIHEAIAQLPNPEVTDMVVADVVQVGYRVGERVLRPAKVAVFVPAS